MYESFLGVNPWTALFVLLNTLTIYFVARKFLFIPVMDIIEKRQQEIDGLYEDAGNAKAESEILRTRYQEMLSEARSTSDRIVKEAVARGQSREAEILRKAGNTAAAIRNKASADIAMEKKKALNDARNQISDLALAIAGKVIAQELTEKNQSQLIDRFLEHLEEGL